MNTQNTQPLVKVTIDNETFFPATLAPETWNGFVMPFFTKETGMEIAEWSYDELYYDASIDAFVDGEENEYPNQDGLYPIGAGVWVWSLHQ